MPKIKAGEIADISNALDVEAAAPGMRDLSIIGARFESVLDPADERFRITQLRTLAFGGDRTKFQTEGVQALRDSVRFAVGALVGGGYLDVDQAAAIVNDFDRRTCDEPDLRS